MVVAYRCHRGGGTGYNASPTKVQGFGNARACVVGVLGYLRNLRTQVYLVISTLIGQFRDDKVRMHQTHSLSAPSSAPFVSYNDLRMNDSGTLVMIVGMYMVR